jgi:Txe/YoeB family toxin of Txe-Axe toxin-antitoxin module
MERIEKLRSELHELLNMCKRGDTKVLAKSEELDREISSYYHNRRYTNANR